MRNTFLKAVGVGGAMAALAAYVAVAQPAGVLNQDVGFPTLPGSYTVNSPSAGKITIVGGGNDIWNSADNFHFAYVQVTGDFDWVVKVESLEGPDAWTKAELMAREGAAGAPAVPADTDRFVAAMTTRTAGQNEVALQWRSDTGTAVSGVGSGCGWPNDIGIAAPVIRPAYPNTWLRLERYGNTFYGHSSTDGVNWEVMRGAYTIDATTLNGNEAAPRTDGPMLATLQVGLAVTAHNDADLVGGVAVFSEWKAYTPVPIAITTQPPATLNVPANSTLTISAAATGDPVHYQWMKGGVDIAGATSATLTIPLVQVADSGSYTVRCFGAKQTPVTSSACVVTVTVDTTAPTITKAVGSATFTEATIFFSEPVKAPSATTAGNYTIAGLAVSAATLSADEFSVTLTTARQAEGMNYVITVNNVQDGGGNSIAANTTVPFKSFSFLAGQAMRQQWNNADQHNNLDTFIQYRIGYGAPPEAPIPPSLTAFETGGFECPTSWAFGDNYGGKLSGWFIPPTTGDYVFYCTSDDSSFLFLSSDASPANKRKIAREPEWENSRAWRGSIRRDANDNGRDQGDGTFMNQSDSWSSTEWGAANPGEVTGNFTIHLIQGNRYYIEGLWQDGTGGDGFGATYRLTTEDEATTIVDNTATRITGALIGTYADTSTLPPTITTHPSGELKLNAGESATFTVVANNPAAGDLAYQWTRNGRDIAGATSASYTIASATLNDVGQYRVKVSNPNGTVWSNDSDANMAPIVVLNGTGLYAIEGEDFDYDNGKSMPAASVMPYYGGAYEGLSAVRGVDYFNDDDPGNNIVNGAPLYRYGGELGMVADDPNTGATIGGEQGNNLNATWRGGEWTMTNNFKLGWVGNGNWGNYTRTFPTPAKKYYVFAASSNDGRDNNNLDGSIGLVTAGVGTPTQTVQNLGTYNAQGTGNWSRNNLVAVTDGVSGPMKEIELGGTVTIRWTYNSGDSEYLLFYPAASAVTPTVSVSSNAQGQPVITFTGVLYGSSTVNGTYAPVAGATSPFTVTGGAGTATFYRAGSQ